MKNIAVIGSGVAALTAAIRLQHDGCQVTIYEKRPIVGGKMGQIAAKGFTFDTGPTLVMLPDIYKEIFAYTGVNPDDYIQFEALDPTCRVNYSDQEIIDASANIVKLVSELEKRGEKTVLGYLKYLQKSHQQYLIAKKYFIEKSFRKPRDFYNFKTLTQALKLKPFQSAHKTIAKYVDHEKIQQLLSFQSLYIGVSPKKGPSLFTMMPMIETLHGIFYMRGGMYSYAQALEKRFLELGGVINLNTEVENILFVNNVAKGVRINKQTIPYDAILINADFSYALENLIKDQRAKGKYTEEKIRSMEYTSSVIILYIGLNKKVPELLVHNVYISPNFENNIKEIATGNLPKEHTLYIYAPSRIDQSLAPKDSEGLYVLVPAPHLKTASFTWSDPLKKETQDNILTQLSKIKGLEDIKTQIVYLKITTPDSFKKEYSSYYGAAFGLAPTLLQSNYYRPKNVYPHAKKLYFAGSSIHPGASIPEVIISGKLASIEIIHDLEKTIFS